MQSVGRNVSATYHLEFPVSFVLSCHLVKADDSLVGRQFLQLPWTRRSLHSRPSLRLYLFLPVLSWVCASKWESVEWSVVGVVSVQCRDEESVLIENNKDVLLTLPCWWISSLWWIAFHRVIRLFFRRNYVTDVIIGNFFGLVLSFLAVIFFQHAQVNCGRNDECYSPHFSILFRAHWFLLSSERKGKVICIIFGMDLWVSIQSHL